MNEPGTIIFAEPGLAIMALGDNKYLIGEKVVELSSSHDALNVMSYLVDDLLAAIYAQELTIEE